MTNEDKGIDLEAIGSFNINTSVSTEDLIKASTEEGADIMKDRIAEFISMCKYSAFNKAKCGFFSYEVTDTFHKNFTQNGFMDTLIYEVIVEAAKREGLNLCIEVLEENPPLFRIGLVFISWQPND